VRRCLENVAAQATRCSAEILLADSSGAGLPDDVPDALRAVRYIGSPGSSVFDLRAIGTAVSTGEVVAWTEDHCDPAPDWCERIISTHREHPEWLAIGGAMLNAEDATTADWANFLTTFGPFVPPADLRKTDRVPPAANISFKREALPLGRIEAGEVEFGLKRRLLNEGRLGVDDRVLVRHIQPRALSASAVVHFHNGRCSSGFLARGLPLRARIGWLLRCLVLPLGIIRNVRVPLAGNREFAGRLARSMPGILILAVCHAAGEFIGLTLNGVGSSPLSLE
jgi:hypothetical protein